MGEFERQQIDIQISEVLGKWDRWTKGVGELNDVHQIAAEMSATLRFIQTHVLRKV